MKADHAIVNRNHACRWLVALALGCLSLTATAQIGGPVGPYGPQNVFDWMYWQSAGYNTRVSVGGGLGGVPAEPLNLSGWQKVNNYNAFSQSANATGQTFTARAEVPLGNTGKKGAFTFSSKVTKPSMMKAAGKVFSGYAAFGPAGAGAMAAFMAGTAFMEWMDYADVEKNPANDVQKPFLIADTTQQPADGYEYRMEGYSAMGVMVTTPWLPTVMAACGRWASMANGGGFTYTLTQTTACYNVRAQSNSNPNEAYYLTPSTISRPGGCPNGTYPLENGMCSPTREKKPGSWEEAQNYFTPASLPSNIVEELLKEADRRKRDNGIEPFTIDVEPTTISNPPTITPDKDTKRTTSPITLPNGQPGTRESTVTTSTTYPINTTGDRVTVKPVTTTTTRNVVRDGSGNVVTDTTDTTTEDKNPDGDDTKDPDTDKNPAKEQEDLCKKNPDILACAKPDLDVPDGTIPKVTKTLTYTQDSSLGGGSCPADKYLTLHGGQQLKVWDWARSCDAIGTYFRPLLLAMAAFVAFIIVIPARTEV